ncbi:Protein tpx2, partial [Entomortierella lignicola]
VFESSGDLGVPKVAKPALTVPKSPVLTKRRHAPLRPAVMPQSQQHNYRKFQPSITQHGLVSSAESARRLSGEKLRRSVRHDQVISHSENDPPQVSKPPLTVPEPFRLETESRGARYQEQFKHKLDRWKQIEKEHQYKALPLPVYPELFVPKKSTKPLTHSVPVHLQTDERAEHWEEIEKERQHKQKLLQDMLAQKAREDELQQLRELKELRQRLVPHPTPIRDYPRIEIRKSSRPLTVPRSPNIGEKRKRQMTLERELSNAYDEDNQIHNQHHHTRQSEIAPSTEHIQQMYEDPEHERELQRESERAQAQEYELRRLSSFSKSRGSEDLQRQDLIRKEIETQRQKDELDRQVIESRNRQHLQSQQHRHQQQQRVSQSYERTEVRYRDEDEIEQNKRRRLLEDRQPQSESQPVFGHRMGRKSWLEANDL